jgi:hypothetical protein
MGLKELDAKKDGLALNFDFSRSKRSSNGEFIRALEGRQFQVMDQEIVRRLDSDLK